MDYMNIFRREYRPLSDEEKNKDMAKLKDLAENLYEHIESLGNSRELALAKTKLEECVMWAVMHITR